MQGVTMTRTTKTQNNSVDKNLEAEEAAKKA